MFICGVNFQLLYKAGIGKFSPLLKNNTFKWYVGVIIVVFVFILAVLLSDNHYDNWYDYILCPLFQIISGLTSTGFSITNFEAWGALPMVLFFVIMFFGACAEIGRAHV